MNKIKHLASECNEKPSSGVTHRKHSVGRAFNERTATTISIGVLDTRLVLLQRASAQLTLVEASVTSLDEAIINLLPSIYEVAGCQCYREILDRWERNTPKRERTRR
jgi:hypothetical protein